MTTTISESFDISGTCFSLATTAQSASKLTSKKRELNIPKPVQLASIAVKMTKLGDKVISELPPSLTSDLPGTDLLTPCGALATLAVDTMNLAIRSGKVLELNKELEKLPWDTQLLWRRQVLEAQSKHAKGIAKISLASFVADSASVIGLAIPVVGLPATLLGGTIGILKFFAEKNLNYELLSKLEKITDEYRSTHSSIIENHVAFKEMHETLKANYEQAILERGRARSLAALDLADAAVADAAKYLKEYEISKSNFDAYTQALQLIRELEPKETPLNEHEVSDVTNARLCTLWGTESPEFASTPTTSSDHISNSHVGVSKNDKALEKIGLGPEKPKKPASPASAKQRAPQKEPYRLSEMMSYGELSFLSGF